MDGTASPDSPAWYGLERRRSTCPDVDGFDVTAGVRNIIGTRDLMPAPADYDRFMVPTSVTVARIPGEGRELFLKLGYSY